MRVSARTAAAILAFFAICAAAGSMAGAQIPVRGSIRGTVADASGGMLPGVTVVATAADGQLQATITDAAGAFILGTVPVGPVHMTFELEGFSTATADVTVQVNVEARVAPRLALAPRNENVVVVGKSPVVPGLATRTPAPPRIPDPVPVVQPVPAHDRDSVCGPAKPSVQPESFGTIRSVRKGAVHDLYAKGDELVIEGGTLNGLEAGRNLVVRRRFSVSGMSDGRASGEHTAGLLQIVTAGERTSTGVVIYACDEMMQGDFLASFNPEPVRAPEAAGIPNFDEAARILFGDDGQMLGAPRRMMVIDRGSDAGMRAGQHLTIFRREPRRTRPTVIGDAVVVAVRNDSATIRFVHVTDAISPGDWAATERPLSVGSPAPGQP